MATKGRFAKVLVDKAVESYVRKTGDNAFLKRLKKVIGDATSSALDRISEVKFYEFSLKFKDKETAEDVLIEDALQFIDSLALEKKVLFIVMLDEFQDVIRWGDETLKRIRVVVQSQKRVCYVLAGSATTVMNNLVYNRRSPFYRQLVEIAIKKLDQKSVTTFLEKRFASVNMQVSSAVIKQIALLSNGFPDYVQRLGLELYLSIGSGGTVTDEKVNEAYEDMVLSLDGEFENYFSNFSPLERELLVALASGKIQPSEVAREVRKPIYNVSKTLTRLINCSILEKPLKGQYRISDPVFVDWLNRRFGVAVAQL
jgi:hypothetical protein